MFETIIEKVQNYIYEHKELSIESINNSNNKQLSIVLNNSDLYMYSIELTHNGALDLLYVDVDSENILSYKTISSLDEEELIGTINHFISTHLLK